MYMHSMWHVGHTKYLVSRKRQLMKETMKKSFIGECPSVAALPITTQTTPLTSSPAATAPKMALPISTASFSSVNNTGRPEEGRTTFRTAYTSSRYISLLFYKATFYLWYQMKANESTEVPPSIKSITFGAASIRNPAVVLNMCFC